ncbi:MAG: glycyl-radical enzyme activating protein, partial [Clostridia bacterium]|nr:glycyl-radical enzyme activating protein [Clostridia bacterium]
NAGKCIGNECKICFSKAPNSFKWDDEQQLPIMLENKSETVLHAAKLCPAKALTIYGKSMTVEEVVREVEKDQTFYSRSEGGVTFSGGEPLMQAEFLKDVLQECKKRSIHSAIETTAYAPWKEVQSIFRDLDYIMVDLKHMDEDKHIEWTGVSNKNILENLKNIYAEFPNKPIKVRTPVIPGFNDEPDTLLAISEFVKKELPTAEYELLKYHRFGLNKYAFIGKEYTINRDVELSENRFEEFKNIVR